MRGVTVQQSVTEIRSRPCPDCPLCSTRGEPLYQGLRDRLFGVSGEWNLKKCFNPDCGLVWLDPRTVPEDIGKLYAAYFTHDTPHVVPRRLARLRNKVKSSLMASTFGYEVGGTNKTLGWLCARIGLLRETVGGTIMWLNASRCGRLLDVGCGSGQFLSQMQKLGWDVAGVEPDPKAVCVARDHFGLPVYQGSIEQVGLSADTFDVVTMNHVIEHTPDPISTLNECTRVLKPGGHLMVVTPNIDSLGHRIFRSAWVHLDPPRHFYLFSVRTLLACAKKGHLRVVDLRTTAHSARWVWGPSRQIRRNNGVACLPLATNGLWTHLQALMFQVVEHILCGSANLGEELVLTATK